MNTRDMIKQSVEKLTQAKKVKAERVKTAVDRDRKDRQDRADQSSHLA
ncbi:hypothetical protein ES703_60530 [subsurface metagenome]